MSAVGDIIRSMTSKGRPPLPEGERKVTVTVRLPVREAQWLKDQPFSAGKIIERLIRMEVQRTKKT